MYPRVVRLSVCLSVTLVHPAKTVGQNEMPFGRDTRVVPSNIVLNRGPGLPGNGNLGWEPSVRSDAAYRQITLAIVSISCVPLLCIWHRRTNTNNKERYNKERRTHKKMFYNRQYMHIFCRAARCSTSTHVHNKHAQLHRIKTSSQRQNLYIVISTNKVYQTG